MYNVLQYLAIRYVFLIRNSESSKNHYRNSWVNATDPFCHECHFEFANKFTLTILLLRGFSLQTSEQLNFSIMNNNSK